MSSCFSNLYLEIQSLLFLLELNEWRNIGNKGELIENKWLETINKKNPKIIKELEKINKPFDVTGLEDLIRQEKKKHFELNNECVECR